jgi:hypothetical protein
MDIFHPGFIGARRVNEPCVRLLVAKCCSGRGALSAWGFFQVSLGSVKMVVGPAPESTTPTSGAVFLFSTSRVPGPFIEDSSQPVKMKMARHLHHRLSHGAGAEPLGPASSSCFPYRPFPDAGLGSPPVAGGEGVPDRGCGVFGPGLCSGLGYLVRCRKRT